MQVLILHDDIPSNPNPDEEDTIATAQMLQTICHNLGWQCDIQPWQEQFRSDPRALHLGPSSVIFNLVETMHQQSRLNYQAALFAQQLSVPYTGGSPVSLWFTSDKILTKQLLSAFNLPTAPWIELEEHNLDLVQALLEQGPLFIKPVCEECSIGVNEHSVIRNPQDLTTFLAQKNPNIKRWLAERFIDGREYNVSILSIQGQAVALPIPEIEFVAGWDVNKPKIIDYSSKWLTTSYGFENTNRSFDTPQESPLLQKLKSKALESWHLLKLDGYVRFDIRVDQQGNPWILEINVNPAIDLEAGFAAAAQQAGIEYPTLIKTIVDEAHYRFHPPFKH